MSSWVFDLRGYIEEEVKKAIEKHLGEKEFAAVVLTDKHTEREDEDEQQ